MTASILRNTWISFPLLVSAVVACTEESPTLPKIAMTNSGGPPEGSNKSDTDGIQKIAPNDAAVRVVNDVHLQAAPIAEGIEIPFVEVETNSVATYIQILRCSSDYEFVDLFGKKLNRTTSDRKDNEWAWTQAIQNSSHCLLTHDNHPGGTIGDLAIGTGTFYYVYNPCVARDGSATGSPGCSFRLQYSSVFKYRSLLQEGVVDASVKVAKAEMRVNGILQELRVLAILIEQNLKACEDILANEHRINQLRHFLVQFGVFTVGAYLGITLFGPIMALMISQMGVGMLSPIIAENIGIPLKIDNRCRDLTISDEFSVSDRIKRMDQLLRDDLPAARGVLQQQLVNLANLDSRIMTYDEAIAKASQELGKDLSPNATGFGNLADLFGGLGGG